MADREFLPGCWGRCGRAIPDAQASELDAYIPPQTMRQGRDCTNPVPRISMLSGKPTNEPRTRLDVAIVLGLMLASASFSGWMVYAVYSVVTR